MDDRHPGSHLGAHLGSLIESLGTNTATSIGTRSDSGHGVVHTIEGRLSVISPVSSASFRADTDQSGEWYVWTRLGELPARGGARAGSLSAGWATMQRCESRELAQRLADDLNQRSLRVAV